MCRDEYHNADVKLKEFIAKCEEDPTDDEPPSQMVFIAVVAFVVASEFLLVFYFMGEHLGDKSAAYAASTAMIIVLCAAAGAALGHANMSRNLPTWRRASGFLGILGSLAIFFYGIGLLSGWRADSVALGFGATLDGYRAMSDLPIFVTALVNVVGFVVVAYELRVFFWSKYWGYRSINRRFEEAKKKFEDSIEPSA